MKIFHILFLMFISCSLFAQQYREYQVSGVLPGYAKPYIYMRKGPVIIDSVKVESGKFSFTGFVDEPTQAALFDKENQIIAFILENNSYRLHSENNLIEDGKLVGGGPTELARRKLEEQKMPLVSLMEKYAAEYELYEAKGDTTAMLGIIEQYDLVGEQYHQLELAYIKDNPQSFLSFFLIWDMFQTFDVEKAYPLYKNLDPMVQNSAVGLRGRNAFEKAMATAEGKIAADFVQNDLQGNPFHLSSLCGRYVLLDFWASWCAPCRTENPNLVRIYERFKDKNFEIVGVSLDSKIDAWQRAVQMDSLTWCNVSDLKGWNNEVAKLYGIKAVPTSFLIDPAGRIVAVNLKGEELETTLEQILNQ